MAAASTAGVDVDLPWPEYPLEAEESGTRGTALEFFARE